MKYLVFRNANSFFIVNDAGMDQFFKEDTGTLSCLGVFSCDDVKAMVFSEENKEFGFNFYPGISMDELLQGE